ncbi:16S rRNA (adenine(1518)-N(6)/adenine(1519)-N(6))-dimethyltransferase RsmA [Spiroplasma taiwanense]|uniref:Ribosomal RNA small subunit methyltransferase A n=1 Tax=Spiroplasma taiwanense CT-1 TaxID=1276220 RepID=S5LYR4_9MOLU|nr:16S rRNA (adenine(1518)-N(6)/adenine(1519)-N(6))-dimethyltransferase RsmA [Spiroplasma taiwanense]AGR41676.1 dimethyladenosine transferase [Spiroplasma taiwanense CT-1]
MEYAKKRFGQNFITDKNLIKKIISTLGEEYEHLIIEIGPGKGALTEELCNKFSKVIAIEIDRDMEKILKSKILNSNFELIISDVLELDLEKLILSNNIKNVSIISNTPYYITSAIIFKTLNLSKYLNKAVFMVQKEVAKRICAKVNENNYNNLSIAVQLYATPKYEFTVSRNLFKPIPNVDSSIVTLIFNDLNIQKVRKPQEFINFVRKIFNNKRKNILNNLTNFTLDKIKAQFILDSLKINSNLRPENISIDNFIKIFDMVIKND